MQEGQRKNILTTQMEMVKLNGNPYNLLSCNKTCCLNKG